MGTSFSSDVGYISTEAAAASNLHSIFNVIKNATIEDEIPPDQAATYYYYYPMGPIPMDELIDQYAKYKDSKNVMKNATIEDEIPPDQAATYFHYDPSLYNYIPTDELIDAYAELRSQGKTITILQSTSGIISLISSSIFIWMIMRSHDRLSTTQNRLLLGLCISDILYSLSWSTFNTHVPSDIDYVEWNARGNLATLTVHGFLITLGMFGGLLYNASLNLYFLALVKYKKSDEFIRAKIEPFLHALPIAVAISLTIQSLVEIGYVDGPFLDIYDGPHCMGYYDGEIRKGFQIPCPENRNQFQYAAIYRFFLIFIPAVIMVVCLGIVYCAVRTQEKKLAKYGVGALRSNLRQQSASTPQQRTVQDEQSSGMWGRMTMSLTALSTSLKSRAWSCRKTNKPVTRSNNAQSQSRAVMHKAFGYTLAWLLSYGVSVIPALIDYGPPVLIYISFICMPLQGLFNLLIFMHPKVMAAKKSKKRGETVSWRNAFSTAFWSRGKKSRNRATSRSNPRGRSNRRQRKNRNENAASGSVQTPMFGGIKKKTNRRRNKTRQEEEEKCEIQVPDNLNPNITRAMYSAACPAIYERNVEPSSSAETTTAPTVNLSASIDDMEGVKKVDFAENVNVGNVLSDIVESSMDSEDEEEGMSKADMENKEMVPMTATADMNEQKETSMEDEDEEKEISADEEWGLNEADKGHGDRGPMVAAADVNEKEETSMEQDEDEEKGISADGEEEMIEAEIGNKDEVPMAVADVKEISTEGE